MLPEAFEKRMRDLLGDEFSAFTDSFEDANVRAVRINTLKADPSLAGETTVELEPIPYCKNGYIIKDDSLSLGQIPEHHSGAFYAQDPGAMAPLSALDVAEGGYVLDMCAAPGGKSGQAAALIGEDGFLLSNEYVPSRAKTLVGNFERLGIRNAIVTNLDTAEFKKLYRAFFDLVIADVPCSGEGMFRKNPGAISEWHEQLPEKCAKRQREILENAYSLVKPGGHIIYSTCTYSTEENEEVVYSFLTSHPDFRIARVKDELRERTADGIVICDGAQALRECRRFYPHICGGEGQFLALLKREETQDTPTILYKGQEKPLSSAERAIAEKFLAQTLIAPPEARLCRAGENIVLISHGVPIPPSSVFSAGVLLGQIRSGVLFPAHQFFSAYGKDFKRKLNLTDNPRALADYLFGEEIENSTLDAGFCAVMHRGAAIGGGKVVASRVKNHYPKGLRNKTKNI